MKKSVYILIFFSLIINSAVFSQSNYQILQENNYNEPVLESGVLNKYKTFSLNKDELKKLKTAAPQTLSLSIPNAENGTFEVFMAKKNVLASGFTVKTPSGEVNNLDLGLHYSGKLVGDAQSLVAFSFYNHCMFGMISNQEGNYNIVFLRDENKNPSARYVLYNDADLTIPNTFSCATDELPIMEESTHHTDRAGGSSICQVLTQYLECDYRMYQDNGSSVQNTVSWTTGMFNVMSALYNNEDINIQISEIFVWNVADSYPFNTSHAALYAFGDTRQDNFNGDLAHLLSTRPQNNGGVAWLNILCNNYSPQSSYGRFAYSNINNSYANLPLWSWTINVVTHETGHNLGSQHTHWCGWELSPGVYGAIDYCAATQTYQGNQCYNGPVVGQVGTVMSYCHISGSVNLSLGFGPLPGNRIRSVVDAANCIATAPGPETPTVVGTVQYCVGDDILLNASSADGTVAWTGPNGHNSTGTVSIPNATASNGGLYLATVTGTNCSISEFVQVQVTARPPTPHISITNGVLKCLPGSASYTYTWYDSNDNPVGTGQTFTPLVSGDYYVIITRNGCSSPQSAMFSYTVTSHASIDEADANQIHVWPNPASHTLFVDYPFTLNNNQLLVLDMSGRIVISKNITNTSTTNIDVSGLSNGMYILEMRAEGRNERSKFLVNQ